MADHKCNKMTKPTLIILGLETIVVSAWIVYSSRKER